MVSEVVSEWQDAGAISGIQQMEVTVQVVAVAPGRPVIYLIERMMFVNALSLNFVPAFHHSRKVSDGLEFRQDTGF